MQELRRNQIFGEFSSILNEARVASVIANEEVTTIRFNFAFELFDNEPYPFTMLYKNIIDELLKKVIKSNHRG